MARPQVVILSEAKNLSGGEPSLSSRQFLRKKNQERFFVPHRGTQNDKQRLAMPRKKSTASLSQGELLDITAKLRTGPCVPALREAVKAWKAGGHKGITDTTRILLNQWFYTDHRLRT